MIMTMAHVRRILVYNYLCIIYPAFVIHMLPRSVIKKCSVYSGILLWFTCAMSRQEGNAPCIPLYWCGSHVWCHDNKDTSLIFVKDCQDWQEGKCADTWYKLSLLRQWSCSGLATCHHATTSVLTYCCFWHMHDTDSLILCLHVVRCWAVQRGAIAGTAGS